MERERYVVIDDDPTGTQAVQDVPVFLRWTEDAVRGALQTSPSVHLLTNARALGADNAEEVTYDAARTARLAAPGARLLLRGDSTLRGHLLPEYRAVVRAADCPQSPVLMLVPALPEAGRVTRGGVHYAASIPVHETAYARDGVFSYRSSRLLEWAEQRTEGQLQADRGVEVGLSELRAIGAAAVVEAIRRAATRGPAVVVPDVETRADLELIADGARRAYARGLPLLVRAAPAFVGVVTGTEANGFVPAPAARDGLLIVCGSYVERTTAQLQKLYEARGIEPVEVDLGRLLGAPGAAAAEIECVAQEVDQRLVVDDVAVLATPRERPPGAQNLEEGRRIAEGIARILPTMTRVPSVVLSKGGITSHLTLAEGLGCDRGYVVGPIAPGVARWRVRAGPREIDYLVFPGNVGDDAHLARVVSLVLDR